MTLSLSKSYKHVILDPVWILYRANDADTISSANSCKVRTTWHFSSFFFCENSFHGNINQENGHVPMLLERVTWERCNTFTFLKSIVVLGRYDKQTVVNTVI